MKRNLHLTLSIYTNVEVVVMYLLDCKISPNYKLLFYRIFILWISTVLVFITFLVKSITFSPKICVLKVLYEKVLTNGHFGSAFILWVY